MSSETMNAENMKDERMNIDTAVTSLYFDIHVYIIYTLIGMVRLALIFISTICVMLGYIFSVCSVWVDKLLIGMSASINIAHSITSINYNIRHMRDIVSGIINRNFASVDDVNEIYSNLFNNGIPINVDTTYIKTEPNSDDESDDDESDDDDDDDSHETSDDGDDSHDGEELANLSELIPIKAETSHDNSDEYADLPELIPIKDETSHDNSDEYADLPELIPIDDLNKVVDEPKYEPDVADNKIYIDDDIQDVTDQYLAKKEAENEANKVIVDLTQADDKNTTSDSDKNTTESM
jgi:hypothetical protein